MNRLKFLRRKKHLTQQQLSKELKKKKYKSFRSFNFIL